MGGAPLSAISGGYIQAGNTGNLMLTPSPGLSLRVRASEKLAVLPSPKSLKLIIFRWYVCLPPRSVLKIRESLSRQVWVL